MYIDEDFFMELLKENRKFKNNIIKELEDENTSLKSQLSQQETLYDAKIKVLKDDIDYPEEH